MFVYSSYHLNISFPSSGSHFNKLERVLETPKNGFVSTVTLWITLNKTNSKTRLFVLYSQNYAARALPILFNTPKKSLLKSSYPSQIFVPKKIPESKISNPKKSFDHPRHLKSRVPPLGILPMNLAGNGKCAKNWNLRDRGTGAQQFRGLVMCEIHRRRPRRYKFEFSICLEWSPTIAEIWDE